MSVNGNADVNAENAVAGDSETAPLLNNGSTSATTRGASFASSVFNLMNAIMGSGILGLAYAMANTGIIAFCIMLIIVASLAAYSIHLLLKLCDQTGINSYEDIGEKALQKPGKVIAGVAIIIQNIGAMSSYLFILKSEFPAAIRTFVSPDGAGSSWYDDGRWLLIMVTFCVVLPLAMLPKIGKDGGSALLTFIFHCLEMLLFFIPVSVLWGLEPVAAAAAAAGFLGYTSSLAFLFVLYFVVVVVVKKWSIPCPLPRNVTTLSGALQISNSTGSECTPKLFVISSKSAYAIPTMAFSFLCHTAVLPIYCELDRPSKGKMQNVANVSISLSMLLYLVSAVFGYLTFYAHVDSELLLGYDRYLPHDMVVMSVRLAILLSVLLTVPLIHFPARKAALLLLFGRRPFCWPSHIMATLILVAVVLLMAIFVPDIRNVFGVVGSTTSSCLLFIFPGIFYLKISDSPRTSLDSIGAAFLVVFGVMMGIFSLTVIAVTWSLNT